MDTLILSNNYIDHEGMKELADVLQYNKVILSLIFIRHIHLCI